MNKNTGTRYTQEFKNDVIRMIVEGGRIPSSVALGTIHTELDQGYQDKSRSCCI